MKIQFLTALLMGAVAFAPIAFAQDAEVDATSATPTIQVENATKLWEQFVTLESAWDPTLGTLYMDGSIIDRTTLTASGPELMSFTAEDYRVAMPAIFEQAKQAGATEAWTNVKVMYDGPARTMVTADLTITANGVASPPAKTQFILFDMPDGPVQVTSDIRFVAAPGYTLPADESAPTVAALETALGTLDASAITALMAADGKIVRVERNVDGDEVSRADQSVADFAASVEEEFVPLREAKGNGRFMVYESQKNEDGSWMVRGDTILSAPGSHDFYNTWSDTLTLVQKDGAWKVQTYERAFQHPAS